MQGLLCTRMGRLVEAHVGAQHAHAVDKRCMCLQCTSLVVRQPTCSNRIEGVEAAREHASPEARHACQMRNHFLAQRGRAQHSSESKAHLPCRQASLDGPGHANVPPAMPATDPWFDGLK